MARTPINPPQSADMPSLARAIKMMATALQQQSATKAQEHQATLHQLENDRLAAEATLLHHQHHTWSLEDFLKHNPPKFNGEGNPDKVDRWMRDIERIFEATQCPEERKLSCVVYMLIEDGEFWWKGMKQMMEGRGENVTWESFKVRFLEEYFRDSARNAKEIEFMQLE